MAEGDEIVGAAIDHLGDKLVTAITGFTLRTYKAHLTQTSTSAPVATVFETGLSDTLVWARTGPGVYTATLADAFAAGSDKVFLSVSAQSPDVQTTGALYNFVWTDGDTLTLNTGDGADNLDDLLFGTGIQIEVYS